MHELGLYLREAFLPKAFKLNNLKVPEEGTGVSRIIRQFSTVLTSASIIELLFHGLVSLARMKGDLHVTADILDDSIRPT